MHQYLFTHRGWGLADGLFARNRSATERVQVERPDLRCL
jgi:hypothetical protein